MALWLAGLGVELRRNPPARPQDNGVVERSQGTGKRWSEPAGCGSPAALQGRIDEQDEHHRAYFPDAAASRLARYPALAHSGRSYAADREAASWSAGRAEASLAGYAGVRRVNARGLVSVYDRNYYVGRRYAGRSVYVRREPGAGAWSFELREGPVIGRAVWPIDYQAVSRGTLARGTGETGKPAVADTGPS